MLLRPDILAQCASDAQESPFPQTSSSVTFTFESNTLILMHVYDIAFIGYLITLQHSLFGASRGGNEGRI